MTRASARVNGLVYQNLRNKNDLREEWILAFKLNLKFFEKPKLLLETIIYLHINLHHQFDFSNLVSGGVDTVCFELRSI